MRTMISDILAQAGFEIVGEAETGSQAVEKYRQLKPDLVTMDIVMPDMGGIDAVREIVKQDPDAKILMCSAMGQQALVVEAIQAGAKDFVVKPFQPSRDVVADLDRAAVQVAGPGRRPTPPPGPEIEAAPPPLRAAGRLVQVTLRAEAPLKGGRALLAVKRAETLGTVHTITPPATAFETD